MTIRVTCSQKRFGRIMGSVAAAVVLVLLVYSTPATALPPRMDTASPFGTKAWKTAPPAWTTSGATRVSPRSPGTLLWDDRFDQAGSFDLGVAIAASDDAVAWTGGTLDAAFNEDVVVQTLAPRTGAVRWQRTFDYQGSSDEGQSIAIDGGVVVVGVSASSSNGDSDWVLLAYDLRTGAQLWKDQQDWDGESDYLQALTASGGRVYAVGATSCPVDTLAPCDLRTRVYDVKTGRLAWDGASHVDGEDRYANGVATTDGLVYTIGGAASDVDSAFIVRAQDARTGRLAWADEDRTPGFNWALTATPNDGQLVAVGFGDDDWLVRSYDARTGHKRWTARYSLRGENLPGVFDGAWKVAADRRTVFAAGYGSEGESFLTRDWVVNAYDARTGRLRWTDVFNPGTMDEAVGGLEVVGGQVVAYGIVDQGHMYIRSYDAESGTVLWEDGVDAFSSPYGVWTENLAVDQERAFITGAVNTGRADDVIPEDAIVRAYDATGGCHGRGHCPRP